MIPDLDMCALHNLSKLSLRNGNMYVESSQKFTAMWCVQACGHRMEDYVTYHHLVTKVIYVCVTWIASKFQLFLGLCNLQKTVVYYYELTESWNANASRLDLCPFLSFQTHLPHHGIPIFWKLKPVGLLHSTPLTLSFRLLQLLKVQIPWACIVS